MILRNAIHHRHARESSAAGNQEGEGGSVGEDDSSNQEDSGDVPDRSSLGTGGGHERGRVRGRGRGRGRGIGRGRSPGRGRGRGGGRGRGRGRGTATARASIFDVLLEGQSDISSVVDDWISNYEANREDSLRDLTQFFIQSAGCQGQITPEMQQTMDHQQIIQRLAEEFDADSPQYPLIRSGPQWKRFRLHFCDFVHQLVESCQYSIIYDSYMMHNIITLLTAHSQSLVRAFRHTATLAAMKLMTALVDVALNLSIDLDSNQRQYDDEWARTRDHNSERLQMLLTRKQELEENNDDIRNMLIYLFKSIFILRYRDVVPDIRSICIEEIGNCMNKLPQQFLDSSYLRYLGWTLYDRVGEVRLKCLQALLPLYASSELCAKMELFTAKFKERLVAMIEDWNSDVGVRAVKLIICIHRYHEHMLTDEDCEHVYAILFTSHRALAQAAGEFVSERLFRPDDETVIKTKRGKRMSRYTSALRDMTLFFLESELHKHAPWLVDSLIVSNPMVKDWECYTDLLLEEPEDPSYAFDDEQESALIEIMVCAVKQSATGELPKGRTSGRRRQLTAEELRQVQDDRTRLTEHFIPILPALLNKYVADFGKVANLLKLPRYFDLEIYTTSRQDCSLDQLLNVMDRIVEMHFRDDVLRACSKTYEALCNETFTFHSKCSVSWAALIDGFVNTYQMIMTDFHPYAANDAQDEETVFRINNVLKKLALFYETKNLGPWNIWDLLWKPWVKAYVTQQTNLPVDGVRSAVAACETSLLWDLKVFADGADHQGAVTMWSLRDRVHECMTCLSALLTDNALNEDAFMRICDTLVIFSRHAKLTVLSETFYYEPSEMLIENLRGFLEERVFVDAHDDLMHEQHKLENLNKCREFLAAYCKLSVCNVIGIRHLQVVFRNYIDFHVMYADIIEVTLKKAAEMNHEICANTIVEALFSLFKELHRDRNHCIERGSEQFRRLKKFAKQFALIFHLNEPKNRVAIAAVQRRGIQLAATPLKNVNDQLSHPPNLAFLELLLDFVNKLEKQDRRDVYRYFETSIPPGFPVNNFDDWEPYRLYRSALLRS